MSTATYPWLQAPPDPPLSSPQPKVAIFSADRRHRYTLMREWEGGQGTVNFVMLNPSTADETKNDATIRRCIGYAKKWGYARLVVTNIFAFRSTDPKCLYPDPWSAIGDQDDAYIISEAGKAQRVVCAWGSHGSLIERGKVVRLLLTGAGTPLHCLGMTANGQPKHPLRLHSNLEPVELERLR